MHGTRIPPCDGVAFEESRRCRRRLRPEWSSLVLSRELSLCIGGGRIAPGKRIVGTDILERIAIVLVNCVRDSITHHGCEKVTLSFFNYLGFLPTNKLLRVDLQLLVQVGDTSQGR